MADAPGAAAPRRLLHRDRFREVARLVDVGALQHGGVVGQELHRQAVEDGRHEGVDGRQLDAMRRLVAGAGRSEEHTSELQSLMRISYAVFCLKKKKKRER